MESLLLVSLCSMSDSILETKIVTFINIYFNKNIVIGFVGEYNYLIILSYLYRSLGYHIKTLKTQICPLVIPQFLRFGAISLYPIYIGKK